MVFSRSFDNCKEASEKIFHSEQEITQPTLLLRAEFETHNRFLRFIGLNKHVLPIDSRIGLKIYFTNLYDTEIETFSNVPFRIVYPGGQQVRPWKINLPNLRKKGDCLYSEVETLFNPEIPGTHQLVIEKVKGVQYADIHGVTDRPYKQIDGNWVSSFHVLNKIEYVMYIVAFSVLIVSMLSFIIALFSFYK
jgi:hypothetical protein